jgi:mannose-6-phosphate isomerase-like protein (cupin superfamily)
MNAKQFAALSPEEREAFHRSMEERVAVHAFVSPEPTGMSKDITPIVKSDLLNVIVQTVREGGENKLHYHLSSETTWLVLRGRAQFFGPEKKLIAELGPLESIFLPGGCRYAFTKVGPEDLDILQIGAVDHRDDPALSAAGGNLYRPYMLEADPKRAAEKAAYAARMAMSGAHADA